MPELIPFYGDGGYRTVKLKKKAFESKKAFHAREASEVEETQKLNREVREKRVAEHQAELDAVPIDEVTGLPPLLDGYVWRIGKYQGDYGSWYNGISLIRLYKNAEDKRLSSASFQKATLEEAREHAKEIYLSWHEKLVDHKRRADFMEQYSGDYPPKQVALTTGKS